MTNQASEDQLRGALAEMGEMLASDGYALDVGRDRERVVVTVSVTEDACADCLTPKSIFRALVLRRFATHGIVVDEGALSITYPGDELTSV